MKRNYIILILFLLTLGASAQSIHVRSYSTSGHASRLRHSPRARRSVGVVTIQQYSDSLRYYREMLGKAVAGNDSLRKSLLGKSSTSSLSAEAGSPLTFKHGVAERLFGIKAGSPEQEYIDKVMMRMYIDHPDLVRETERKLAESGEIAFRPNEPLHHEVALTNQETDDMETIVVTEPSTPNVQLVTTRPNFWTFAGDYSLQFLQNYVSDNWYKGGESSYAMIGATTLQANYNDKEKIKWDNKLEMKLGMQSSQGDTLHQYKASEDLFRFTSKLGVQATKRWYYTIQGIVQTQFTRGYKSNDAMVYSDFLSPLNVNISLGMDYKLEWFKKHLTGTVNISPLASNYKYVGRLALASRNGIDEGDHAKWDLGSTFTADLKWKFSNLVKWETRLYAFTSYHHAQVEWENTITFQLSKYISTKVFVYPRFDDSAKTYDEKLGYFQLKEYWSMGFNYSF